MWKLNSRKLDMIIQFDFIRIDVANFICTTFFEHNYLCIHLFSIPVNTLYFIFFLFLFLHPFRRSLYNVHIILWQFWQYVTSLYLLTYDDFEKHTHFFYAMLMYLELELAYRTKKVVRPDTLLFISLLVKVVFI